MFSGRVRNWEAEFRAVLAHYRGAPFVYGETDCAHFAADVVRAVTGRDVLGPLRGAYASRLEARARLKALGYRDARTAAGELLRPVGGQSVPPQCAAYADIGVSQCGAILVRAGGGFVGRDISGGFRVARPATAFAVGW